MTAHVAAQARSTLAQAKEWHHRRVEEGGPRYRAVRLRRRQQSALLRAGIEDARSGDLIRVADAGMAVFLADVLNRRERGGSLPSAGEPRSPSRFQLVHDATALTSAVGVVYLHRSKARMVANAPNDAAAQEIARVLNHVDYPMIESRSWLSPIAKPGLMVENVPELPRVSLASRKARASRSHVAGYVFAVGLPIVLLLALLVVADWRYAVGAVLGYVVIYVAMHALLRRG